jgi:hypothetical protein
MYSRTWEFLVDLNIFCIEKMKDYFDISTPLVRASDYSVTEHNTQRLVDLCSCVGADTYLSGKDGSQYMDMSLFGYKINLEILILKVNLLI